MLPRLPSPWGVWPGRAGTCGPQTWPEPLSPLRGPRLPPEPRTRPLRKGYTWGDPILSWDVSECPSPAMQGVPSSSPSHQDKEGDIPV